MDLVHVIEGDNLGGSTEPWKGLALPFADWLDWAMICLNFKSRPNVHVFVIYVLA
jgi:hypothetical protein